MPAPGSMPSGKRWIAAIFVTTLWTAALAFLALGTANPVTLNRQQIEDAGFVVTARILDANAGTIQVTREWKQATGETRTGLSLDNLRRTEARTGRDYLIPITRIGGSRYIVTESRLSNARPLIYPATPEATAALESLLEAFREQKKRFQ